MVLFERHKHLLALLDALSSPYNATVRNTDFQKWLLLYCRTLPQPVYDFVPYKYGGFSFTSYADRRKLTAHGLLEDNDNFWQLTAAGRAVTAQWGAICEQTERFARQYAYLRGDDLIAHTYRCYPWLATRSEIVAQVLKDDSKAQQAIEQARPIAREGGVWTIGYEGLSVDAYLDKLLQNNIDVLCDVRNNPLSRKYGFSKKELARNCERLGIRYHHLPELGIASAERRNLTTQSDYETLFEKYERDDLPRQQATLNLIHSWVLEDKRVALTCYELSPHQCHRHCVAEAVARLFNPPLSPVHL